MSAVEVSQKQYIKDAVSRSDKVGNFLEDINSIALGKNCYIDVEYSSNDGCLKYYLMEDDKVLCCDHNLEDFVRSVFNHCWHDEYKDIIIYGE